MNWQWITDNLGQVAVLVIMFVGILIIARAARGSWSTALGMAAVALLGALFVGAATNILDFSGDVGRTVTNSP